MTAGVLGTYCKNIGWAPVDSDLILVVGRRPPGQGARPMQLKTQGRDQLVVVPTERVYGYYIVRSLPWLAMR